LKTIVTGSRFRKDLKSFRFNEEIENSLKDVLSYLQMDEILPTQYKDHSFIGEFKGCRDCYLLNDVVLIYEVSTEEITLIRIGTHSKLFG